MVAWAWGVRLGEVAVRWLTDPSLHASLVPLHSRVSLLSHFVLVLDTLRALLSPRAPLVVFCLCLL